MKKLLSCLCVVTTILSSTVIAACATEELDMQTDYAAEMILAAASGDVQKGRKLEKLRDRKKELLEIEDNLNFDDMYILAKIVEAEAGSVWIEQEHKMLVASVVLNRVDSPEFPDTIQDVILQRGQYAAVGTKYFNNLLPSVNSVKIASDAIQYGSIAPKSVVFQAEFIQGGGLYKVFYPEKLGTTYFCHSSNQHLYN